MWAVLLIAFVLATMLLKYRETFIIKYGNPFDDQDIVSFDYEAKGTRLIAFTPDTCPGDKPELDAGLCYERCVEGYNGVGPICWAQTKNVGIGLPVGLEPCPAGWINDGLICREPLRWDSCRFKVFGGCLGGLAGGRLQGRLNNGGICDWPADRGNLPNHLVNRSNRKNYVATHPDRVAGLCYRKCPKDFPKRVPAMPYLCFKGDRGLGYGRGVGIPPPIFAWGAA